MPVDAFFIPDFCNPATYISPAGLQKDILCIFADPDADETVIGTERCENIHPHVTVRSSDIIGLNHSSQIILHAFLEDEAGNMLIDESGNLLVSENVQVYQVAGHTPDGTGIALLELTIQGEGL